MQEKRYCALFAKATGPGDCLTTGKPATYVSFYTVVQISAYVRFPLSPSRISWIYLTVDSLTTYTAPTDPLDPESAALDLIVQLPAMLLDTSAFTSVLRDCAGCCSRGRVGRSVMA
jgi:hypothetical protein